MAWIYVIKNNINDKLYVGKTEVGIEERFKRHVRDAKNGSECAIHRAMRKHGVKHFWPELIEETDNPNEREVYWIKELGAYEHGYNETRGGEGSLLHDRDYIIDTYNRLGTLESVAIETGISLRTVVQVMRAADSYQKKLLPQIKMYDMNLVEIKTFSNLTEAAEYILKEGKTKASLSSIKEAIGRCCLGKQKKVYGYIFEYIEKNNKKPRYKHHYYEIIQTDLDDNFIAKYNSCNEAAKAINGLCPHIRKCCLGIMKTYKGFKWKFGREIQCGNCRPVLQIEKLTGKVIKKWDSINAAANALRISDSSIGDVCKGRKKSAGGFIWRYADEMGQFAA